MMFGYLLLHNKPNPKLSGIKTTFTCSWFWNLGRAQWRQLSSTPPASVGVAQLELKDPLPRWIIHMASKLVLAITWELSWCDQLGPGCTDRWPLRIASLGSHKTTSGFPGNTSQEQTFQKDKPQCVRVYQASSCITLTDLFLTEASHLAKPRVIVGEDNIGHEYWCVYTWFTEDHKGKHHFL